jgi:hypothetical protein
VGTDSRDQNANSAPSDDESSEAMRLLHEGVPLALIADLANPGGPRSPEILAEEGMPDVGWLGDTPRDLEDEDSDDDDDAEVGVSGEA